MPKPLAEWIHLLLPDDWSSVKVLFRVDAGRIWGLSFGHLSRCLTLAGAFQKLYDSETLFLMRDYAEGVEHARNAGQRIHVIPVGLSNEQETVKIAKSVKQFAADVLIVDLPYENIDTSYFTYLRNNRVKVIFIDDCRYISPDADVILNSSILAAKHTKQIRDKHICYLLGPEYFIFEEPRRVSVSQKSNNTLNIVITFGGSDPAGLTLKVLNSLSEEYWSDVCFTVILSPGYAHVDQIKTCIREHKNEICIVSNPSNIYPFFLDCDLAICSGGRTLYELHALHVPIFAIASIEHEIPVIQVFLEQNMLVAGLESWDEQKFQKRLEASINFVKHEKCNQEDCQKGNGICCIHR